jgi:hypothetical protein
MSTFSFILPFWIRNVPLVYTAVLTMLYRYSIKYLFQYKYVLIYYLNARYNTGYALPYAPCYS